MAIPQFRSEGTDQNGTATSVTPSFAGFTFQANDIIEIIFVTDGTIPTLSTPNGFVVAQDPAGNTASISTSGGTVGAAECAVTVFWKRAAGTGDSPPVIATNSATNWCLQPNSFSGVRTTGTPYHSITSAILTTASTAVTSVAASSTLANCLFMPRVASAEDDQAFNNWTMTGSAGPSGTGAPNTGWHSGNGNSCAFTGDEGGFAAATGNVTATTTFATSTKQAKVTLVMASLAEAFGADDEPGGGSRQPAQLAPLLLLAPPMVDELPVQSSGVFEDASPLTMMLPLVAALFAAPMPVDELPTAAAASIIEEDIAPAAPLAYAPQSLAVWAIGDEIPVTTTSAVDEDVAPPALLISWIAVQLAAPVAGDELPGGTLPSGIDEDAALPVALPAGPLPWFPARLSVEEFVAQPGVGLSIGVTAWREKANTTTPNTGTVTTLASYPAWPASTNEQIVVDPRVTNAGNVYELATSGTTASSGGPTTTPAPVTNGAITDNAAKWNYLVTGTGAADTQTSGSLFLVSSGQGSDTNSGTTPTDNKSNTYSKIGSTSFFAGFPQSSAASFVAALPSTGGTGHTISGTYGLGLDGGGDEKSLMFVEVIGGTKIQDHSQGEFSPNGSNVVTSNSVTTTQAAVLVCFCWLNGGTHADGFLHTATPGSGFALLPLASGLLEIGNTAGQVQGCTIWKAVASAGTYTASITTGAGLSEGSVMHLIAIQGPDVAPSIGVDDDPGRPTPIVAPLVAVMAPAMVDELAVAPGDDEPGRAAVLWPQALAVAAPTPADEIVGFIAPDEDQPGPVWLPGPLWSAPAIQTTDELAILAVEDNAPIAALLAERQPLLAAPTIDDELPAPIAAAVDEDISPIAAWPIALPVQLTAARPVDELPIAVVVSIIDDPSPVQLAPVATVAPLPTPHTDDELPVAVVASMVDDAAPVVAFAAVGVAQLWQIAATDELPAATAADEDISPPQIPIAWPTVAPVATSADDDLPRSQVVDDLCWSAPVVWVAPDPVPPVVVTEELPSTPPPPAPLVDDDPAPYQPLWLPPAIVVVLAGPADELPTPIDPTAAWEDAIYQWVLTGSRLAPSQVIWSTGGTAAGAGGRQPSGLYISMRIIDVDQVSDDWLIPRREGGGIVHHVRGTRHPMLELRCFAGDSTGARQAELVLSRVMAAVMLPSVTKALRRGAVGVGTCGKVRVMPGTRSGLLAPLAMVEVELHIMIDVSEAGEEFVSVDVTTPGPVGQTVVKP